MGIDAGFDMVPRLSKGIADKHKWHSFLETIKERYQNDARVEVKPNYIVFNAGEHPMLPLEGHKFLRFSSKISGSHAEGVQTYIDCVAQVAKLHFGSRVRYWNDIWGQYGFYSWREVNDSIRLYEQPDEPETPTTEDQLVVGTDPISESNLQLYDIQSVPRKGKGLVARIDIAKGQRILCEQPLFTVRNLSPISLMERIIATELKALSKPEQRQFLALHNNFPGKHPFSGTVKTNALPCGPGSELGGIYPTICLINHNCLPNAHHSWNSDTNRETIHAIRPISAGEEITISYVGGDMLSSSRRAFLQSGFGFDCDCRLCARPLPDLQRSDARRLQIESLDHAIGDPYRVLSQPEDCLADCHRLRQILDVEYEGSAVATIPRLYYDAFQISITHGDQARASVFAERAYRSRLVCEGEDSPETKRMKSLMERPAAHRNFGASRRWKTAKNMVPKGLGSDEFEKWLWRLK
ncbi:hypothetical protein PRK78_006889 [Emydomyces testavorans]|uniref:SET domain-containing protein n=1 Tax=Emydomyces testavorans TaxID=2070801 RepID=A0AAF0DN85_9EURO|nr:hypothetical protein PRK78_006889 [Emydomyces testavorans]